MVSSPQDLIRCPAPPPPERLRISALLPSFHHCEWNQQPPVFPAHPSLSLIKPFHPLTLQGHVTFIRGRGIEGTEIHLAENVIPSRFYL